MTPPSTLQRWLDAAAVYTDRRVLAILFLGFSSGLPLALTGQTLSIWLTESGVDKTTIGLFALVGIPYTFKFLWAPLIDRVHLPWLTRRLGRRRGWLIATQLTLMGAVVGLGATSPQIDPWWTALIAFVVAFCSASQDIVIDAYRVEILRDEQQGAGAANIVMGYRLGMLASGAGGLYLATYVGWMATYGVMAALVLIGMATVLLNPEPSKTATPESLASEAQIEVWLEARPHLRGQTARALSWIYGAVVAPFADFMSRKGWWLILLFILLYKFGDAIAGVMSNPFYIEMGFSKIEIANISKVFGLWATIVGGVIGGVIVTRLGIMKSLLICGLLQMVSNLMFVLLAQAGHSIPMLIATIAVENLSGGMGTAAFVAYLSALCNVAYTATQYALLSSFMAFGRTVLSSSGGWIADHVSWVSFFLLSTAAALPGLLLLLWMAKRYPIHPQARQPVAVDPFS
ncbi:MAG: MFS transporter [Alphaproteobacteria bacterium CG_4_10_14_0_2_um_filter_63_37]|nr:MAG: MFS transporter [Proteobacteria bacterium CG1_02_64_396]PJA24122.1 MAG: MFS transporter [Alphaproteobacteria bacterium CG_4_10_14_0_2_um_filter_63_37]